MTSPASPSTTAEIATASGRQARSGVEHSKPAFVDDGEQLAEARHRLVTAPHAAEIVPAIWPRLWQFVAIGPPLRLFDRENAPGRTFAVIDDAHHFEPLFRQP